MSEQTYRLKQTVHPATPSSCAWEALNYQAALKLWARLEAEGRPGQWFAVRVKKWSDTTQGELLYFAGPPLHELYIDLEMIALAEREPPRFAPGTGYESVPVERLAGSALAEIGSRIRRQWRKLWRQP